ncbi:urease accessory protein UreD [Mesorhizobium sp. AR10]|nr:urease accessory protein UreD [Mesorhizobium sp. AR10]UVK41407.1 urease accessory protein UreD [Mesorhizobium sp. AR10]
MDTMEHSLTSVLPAQRVAGMARLVCASTDGRTRLRRLYQDGSAKIRMPAVASDPLEAVLINTAGGLTGGDRLGWEVDVGAGASATITTQACEKIYRAASDRAEVRVKLTVGEHGRIAWLPQETIVFDRSAFARTLDVELAVDAEALLLEATVFGRLAMGERAAHGHFHDRWRVSQEGALVHAEDFRIGPGIAATLGRSAVAGGAIAVATVLMVSPRAAAFLDPARHIIGGQGDAGAWSVKKSGKLLARLFAEDGYQLRKRLVPLVELLNGRAGLPKLWSL